MGYSSDSSSRGSRKKHKKRKKHSSRKDSKKRSRDDSSYDRKRSRKERKEKKSKKRKRDHSPEKPPDRNEELASALCTMFDAHPALAGDLPIMLVRMVGGVSIDLSQSTDTGAAKSLNDLFCQLKQFGLELGAKGWSWKGPQGPGRGDELLLVKVIKAMLNDVGFTVDAIEDFESDEASKAKKLIAEQQKIEEQNIKNKQKLRKEVELLLKSFKEGSLNKEIAGICEMISSGETISLDDVPDDRLRSSLDNVFTMCGLEKVEMELSDTESNADAEPARGFSVPEGGESTLRNIQVVVDVCQNFSSEDQKVRRPMKGPMMNPADYAEYQEAADSDDSGDEGPAQYGQSTREAQSMDVVKEAAERRAREIMLAKGISVPESGDKVREEWMVDPGKFDFLSAVKATTSTTSRQFRTKVTDSEQDAATPMAPAIKSEINSIMEAHKSARGPSLFDQHREAKAEKATQDAMNGDSWKWSRDKDLDSGRRVDKNALNMVLGGATDGLKSKFQGANYGS